MGARSGLSVDQRASIYCIKHGHSRLHDHFFGYHYCARCGAQLGDSLGGVYNDPDGVYVHHMHLFAHDKEALKGMRGCKCPENAEKLTKQDFVYVKQWNRWGFEQRPPWRSKG